MEYIKTTIPDIGEMALVKSSSFLTHGKDSNSDTNSFIPSNTFT